MQYNFLGNSSLKISQIGFGCMSMGGNESLNSTLVERALDRGINFFDTADLYNHGMNELSLGKSLSHRRQQAIIATKVGNQWRDNGNGWDWKPGKEYILSAVEKSLIRLKTDYIDLYQLHGGTMEDPVDEVIEAFQILQTQGKIRYYGISSLRINVIREYVDRSSLTSVMMQYSLLDRRPDKICREFLQPNNIGVLARGSLAKGLLAGNPATSYLNYSEKEVALAGTIIQKFSGPLRTAAQTAQRLVLQQPFINSVLVGIRTMNQLEEAAGTSDTPLLTKNELDQIAGSIPMNQYDLNV